MSRWLSALAFLLLCGLIANVAFATTSTIVLTVEGMT
jgi:hypothetical protein